MTFRETIDLADALPPGLRGGANEFVMLNAMTELAVTAIRPLVFKLAADAARGFRAVIPVDTGLMRSSVRYRTHFERGVTVVKVRVDFSWANGEWRAFQSLAKRYRPDLRGWPVKYLAAKWPAVQLAAAAAVQPVVGAGTDAQRLSAAEAALLRLTEQLVRDTLRDIASNLR